MRSIYIPLRCRFIKYVAKILHKICTNKKYYTKYAVFNILLLYGMCSRQNQPYKTTNAQGKPHALLFEILIQPISNGY